MADWGRIDFYGFSERAAGLVFIGWVPHEAKAQLQESTLLVKFDDLEFDAPATVTFYRREQLGNKGIGAIIFIPASTRPQGIPVSISVLGDDGVAIVPGDNMQEFAPAQPPHWLYNVIAKQAQPTLPEDLVRALFADRREVGCLEVFGFEELSQSWLFGGWLPALPDDVHLRGPGVRIADMDFTESAIVTFYRRDDLDTGGVGVVGLVHADRSELSDVSGVELRYASKTIELPASWVTKQLGSRELCSDLRGRLAASEDGPEKARLLTVTRRPFYSGTDTTDRIADRIRISVDESIFCAPDGLVLKGWMLARPGALRCVKFCSSAFVSTLDFDTAVRIPRPDVVEGVGRKLGFEDPSCGFALYIPEGYSRFGPNYLQIETTDGDIAFLGVPAPRLHGLAAIRQLLGDCELQYADVEPAFDRVLGPSVSRLNAERLAERPRVTTVSFGTPRTEPVYSIVVPVYRRLDYIELQFALFARDRSMAECELIYVLDDPPKRRELENLAAAVYERFRIPFTLVLLDRNMGFAPACNAGLAVARGRFVCFLNSDAFPQSEGWLPKLRADLDGDAGLGAIGPLLLFEDGSVQHEGISWQRLPQFGGWYYNDHPRMGLRPPHAGGIQKSVAITGACVLMRAEVAAAIGGFDEDYVVGDFEDSDLCLKLHQRGLSCAVDLDVRMVHLMRKSQPSSAERWRQNLILYNAWLHHQRWGATIERLLASGVERLDSAAASATL